MTTEVENVKGNQSDQNGVGVGVGTAASPASPASPTTGWVHFEEDATSPVTAPAVISTESVQVNLERSSNTNNNAVPGAVAAVSDGNIATIDPKPLRNVTLQVETVRQGFCEF